jgi:predicted amidophosphoribosyltransferase
MFKGKRPIFVVRSQFSNTLLAMPTDSPLDWFCSTPQPLKITCPRCKKKILKEASWFQKKGVSCPKCGTPLDTDAILKTAERSQKRMSKLGKKLKRLDGIISCKPKL